MGQRERNKSVLAEMTSLSHIGWTAFDSEGVILDSRSYGLCYLTLYDLIMEGGVHQVLILQTEHRTNPENIAYTDYIVNRSQFKDAFLTKDIDLAFESGFEVNTDAHIVLVKGAIAALRVAFETPTIWPWKRIVDLGYTEDEAYALSINCSLTGYGSCCVCPPRYYLDHQVHLPMYPYESYLSGMKFKGTLGGTVKSGELHSNIQDAWGRPAEYEYDTYGKHPWYRDLDRTTLDNILQKLKDL